jgi:hypothetical protein
MEYKSWGKTDGKRATHYGVAIDLDKPTTGVVSLNSVEHILDELYNGDAIDLAWEEHLSECEKDDHDRCGPDERGTILIGAWKKGDDGKYEPDVSGEYAAIVGETNAQVVWSRHTKRCAGCSPCYPGQADLNSPSEDGFLCFDLPPEMYGE